MPTLSGLPNWHPFLVHFPVALFTSAFVCDVALLIRFRHAWLDRAAMLMYVLAAVGSGAAALSGKLAADAMASGLSPEVNEAVAIHGDWAFFSVLAMCAATALRFDALWRDRERARPSLHRGRLASIVVSAAALVVLTGAALRGGELVYRRGVAVDERAIIPLRR